MKKFYDCAKNATLRWLPEILAGFAFFVFCVLVGTIFSVDCKCNIWYCGLFGAENKLEIIKLLGLTLAGFLSALAVMVANKRANAMIKQAKAMATNVEVTESGKIQERFRDAVNHLGNKSPSVRQGGFHSLFHLALGDKNLRPSIASILCAHIRETTSTENYQEKHKSAPSTEIQSLLSLLFTAETHSREKLEKFWDGLTPDLTGGYLQGIKLQKAFLKRANLREAHLQEAHLEGSELQETDFCQAQLQGAYLSYTHLQKANLEESELQKAKIYRAQLQGANLESAQLQGANLWAAQLQGAYFLLAQLQGADLESAQLQGANFMAAQLQGADLRSAQLQGANLESAQLQGADLRSAQLQGVNLESAQLQGAYLADAQLQGVNFHQAQLQGAVSSKEIDCLIHFRSLIRNRVGKDSDLSTVVFKGGVDDQSIYEWISILKTIKYSSDERLQSFRKELGKHVGIEISHRLPDEAEAITGEFNKEEAKKWVEEYKKAMATVPKFIK